SAPTAAGLAQRRPPSCTSTLTADRPPNTDCRPNPLNADLRPSHGRRSAATPQTPCVVRFGGQLTSVAPLHGRRHTWPQITTSSPLVELQSQGIAVGGDLAVARAPTKAVRDGCARSSNSAGSASQYVAVESESVAVGGAAIAIHLHGWRYSGTRAPDNAERDDCTGRNTVVRGTSS